MKFMKDITEILIIKGNIIIKDFNLDFIINSFYRKGLER